jgi:large subunit ribosomal protein L24
MARKPLVKKIKTKAGIKKGDTVRVLAGRDKGKQSEVVSVDHKSGKIVVRDINVVKKATRPDPKKNPQGGIVSMPAPMLASKAMVVCPRCGKPTRISFHEVVEGKTTRKSRKCRKCGELIDG